MGTLIALVCVIRVTVYKECTSYPAFSTNRHHHALAAMRRDRCPSFFDHRVRTIHNVPVD